MTTIFHSGTPKNDGWQWLENRFCHCRLFSLYRGYRAPVLQWLRDLKENEEAYAQAVVEGREHDDFAFYAYRYPALRQKIARRDRARRQRQYEAGDDGDFDTLDHFSTIEPWARRYPRRIMLDSGAFTAWRSGKVVTLSEFMDAVHEFEAEAGDLFDEITVINLDVITSKESTASDVRKACDISDRNFDTLSKSFPNRVLPVYHQFDERAGDHRLDEVIAQANGYICLSPNNKEPEKSRIAWARKYTSYVRAASPDTRIHGLATTGVRMLYEADFDTVDSASWTEHARLGMVDLLDPNKRGFDAYRSMHVSREKDEFDEIRQLPVAYRDQSIHFASYEQMEMMIERCEEVYGFPWKMIEWEQRPRALVSMSQLSIFAQMWGGAMFTDPSENDATA